MPSDAVEVEPIRIEWVLKSENPPRYKWYNNWESFMSGETEAIAKTWNPIQNIQIDDFNVV